MEPMKPMESMEPMKPIMEPMSVWWPAELNDPTVAGSQDGAQYAFFPHENRLLIIVTGPSRPMTPDNI
jgi:hypothetical protein